MSCLSRLVGLICAFVPGLLFLAFSARFFFLWPELGFVIGPLYSLVSLITGIVCLYLGLSLLLANGEGEESVPVAEVAPAISAPPTTVESAPEPVAAPLPEPLPIMPAAPPEVAPTSSIFARAQEPDVAPDTPESRIRQLAATRPGWQATAAQLAHLANLNMNVADATARAMASNGDAQIQTGPNGETVYVFDLAQ